MSQQPVHIPALLTRSELNSIGLLVALSNFMEGKPTANWAARYVKDDRQVIRLINACTPGNKGAGAIIHGMGICITDAEPADAIPAGPAAPGTIIAPGDREGLIIHCFDHKAIRINVISTHEGLFAGKKLRAYGIKINDRFLSPD